MCFSMDRFPTETEENIIMTQLVQLVLLMKQFNKTAIDIYKLFWSASQLI